MSSRHFLSHSCALIFYSCALVSYSHAVVSHISSLLLFLLQHPQQTTRTLIARIEEQEPLVTLERKGIVALH